MKLHLDLFSGIGGFAYAADQVFGEMEHVFCDNDAFCREVLKKHWPEAKIYDDIRAITNPNDWGQTKQELPPAGNQQRGGEADSNARSTGLERHERKPKATGQSRKPSEARQDQTPFLLTGGFPCQPFSAAGLRRGTADERHLWPEMLRVIRLTKPQWVIAENVRGLITWNEGLVFEQVCADLESSGYTVQAFIIPAVAVGAPHRRDRIWFVAHADSRELDRTERRSTAKEIGQTQSHRTEDNSARQSTGTNERLSKDGLDERYDAPAADTTLSRGGGRAGQERRAEERELWTPERTGSSPRHQSPRRSWSDNWLEVATELCRVDDGLPVGLDGFKLSKSKHREERLKSLGNAIVPQVAMEIMKGMTA